MTSAGRTALGLSKDPLRNFGPIRKGLCALRGCRDLQVPSSVLHRESRRTTACRISAASDGPFTSIRNAECQTRGAAAHEQRARLERLELEGVEFNRRRVDIERFEHSFTPWQVLRRRVSFPAARPKLLRRIASARGPSSIMHLNPWLTGSPIARKAK